MRTALGLILILLLAPGVLAVTPNASQPRVLRVVFSLESFTNINRNDAVASAKAWIESVGHRRGLNLKVEVDTYSTIDQLTALVEEGAADLFIVSSTHFVALDQRGARWSPVFIPQQGDTAPKEYILLTPESSKATLADLRGKHVIFLQTMGAHLGRIWMDTELANGGAPASHAFFGDSQETAKPSAAVLPVFFGKAQGCVVDRPSFDTLRELNPQIGATLGVRLSSPPFVETVICIQNDYQEYRNDLLDGLAELHEGPAGQALLTVFKIDKLVPYDDDIMTSVRILFERSRTVTGGGVR